MSGVHILPGEISGSKQVNLFNSEKYEQIFLFKSSHNLRCNQHCLRMSIFPCITMTDYFLFLNVTM